MIINALLSRNYRLTGQFADKLTRGQSSRGLVNSLTVVNSPTANFTNHGITKLTLYLYTKPNLNPYPNPIRIDSVLIV